MELDSLVKVYRQTHDTEVEPQKLQVNQVQKKSKHFEEIKLISLNSLLHVTNDSKHNSDPQEDN